jgi:hypothetical protein
VSKLQLPNITLVMIDTREHVLARMAIEDCLDKVDFGEVLIFTDRPLEFAPLVHLLLVKSSNIHQVPNWPTKLEYAQFRWREVAPYLSTSHALFIEWDAWVWDESMWIDEFLKYDYIGPPWRYEDDKNVGGGGFCLVSTKLKKHLHDHLDQYPCPIISDDWLLCCEYRPRLEAEGFIWAPEDLAHQFSFEYYRPSSTSLHFGFHGIFNFDVVLTPERLEERTRLMLSADYIRNRGGSDGDGGEDVAKQRFKQKNAFLLNRLQSESSESKMKKLQLLDCTLVMVETREHKLALMAIEDCLDKADFGDVLILTDRPLEFAPLTMSHGIHPRFKIVDDWPDKLGWSRSFWSDVPPLLETAYTLNIQWDSWIWDATQWTDEFLSYDYIGAPWWYKDGKNVGNGGFSLISTRLKRYVHDHRDVFSCVTSADDDLLCRKYRPALQDKGFIWAPEQLAHQFAFECCRPSPTSRHFGFHAMFNWPEVLPSDRLRERVKIAMASDYITNFNGVIWRAFVSKHSALVDELLLETGKELTGAKHG